jgi:hypothetical protein
MHRHTRWGLLGLVAGGIALAGCGTTSAEYGEISQSGPVQVSAINGSDVNKVTLTPEAASKLGVQTTAVESGAMTALSDDQSGPQIVVPLDSVIYDKDGNTWVYVSDGPRSYQRDAVKVAHVDGDSAVLSSGPPAGAKVVTVGAQELLGAELGVGGE